MHLLHVADTHLGSSRPSGLRARELDFYDVFDEVIEIAIKEGVDAVLHCGDLFDEPRPSPQAYSYAVKSLKKLRDSGIDFLVIAGQHDQPKISALSPIKVLEEVGLAKVLATFKPETRVVRLRSGDLGITAVPYAEPQLMQELVKGVEKPDTGRKILMAHLLLKELNIPGAHLSLTELRSSYYDYVALGDYHARYETRHEGVPVIYPGSTEALDYLESRDERFVALVDLSREEASVDWIKLSRFRKWLVIKSGTYSELIRRLRDISFSEFPKPPILRAEVSSAELVNADPKLVMDYMRKLKENGKILTYVLKSPSISGEFDETQYEEATPLPTLESVVHNLLKDPKISEYVLRIIKDYDDESLIKTHIMRLIKDQELLSKLEKLVNRSDHPKR
ncbi:MAG: DNA repair exonuclease [Zestosphaera sp.]